MKAFECFGEKLSAFIIGIVLLVIGILFLITGFTVLPIIGFVIAVPAIIASIPFLKSAVKRACEYYGYQCILDKLELIIVKPNLYK